MASTSAPSASSVQTAFRKIDKEKRGTVTRNDVLQAVKSDNTVRMMLRLPKVVQTDEDAAKVIMDGLFGDGNNELEAPDFTTAVQSYHAAAAPKPAAASPPKPAAAAAAEPLPMSSMCPNLTGVEAANTAATSPGSLGMTQRESIAKDKKGVPTSTVSTIFKQFDTNSARACGWGALCTASHAPAPQHTDRLLRRL
jgi:hypothetical protein